MFISASVCGTISRPTAPPPGASATGAPSSDTAPSVDALPRFDKVAVLGNALWLMQRSGAHKHLFLSDIEWMLVPPVALEQYRLWRKEKIFQGRTVKTLRPAPGGGIAVVEW